mgnify:CR=1 FL=1
MSIKSKNKPLCFSLILGQLYEGLKPINPIFLYFLLKIPNNLFSGIFSKNLGLELYPLHKNIISIFKNMLLLHINDLFKLNFILSCT